MLTEDSTDFVEISKAIELSSLLVSVFNHPQIEIVYHSNLSSLIQAPICNYLFTEGCS